MIIWIIDDDVGFSYALKTKILDDEPSDDTKVLVFQKLTGLDKQIEKIKKDSALNPHLIFLDTELETHNNLKLYLEWQESFSKLSDVCHFCSAASFGHFENFFKDNKTKTPPFIQKSQLEKKLEDILKEYIPKSPELTKASKRLEALALQMRDLYYNSEIKNLTTEQEESFKKLKALAERSSYPKLVKKIDKLTNLLTRKQKPSFIRAKSFLKDVVLELKKVKLLKD